MKGKIRSAIRKDIEKITKLFNNESNTFSRDSENEYEEEDIENYMNNKLNKFFICEIEEEITGVLLAQFWKNYVYLHTIIIDQNFRKNGIGTILMNSMEKLAKEQNKYTIELFTEIKNKNMQEFIIKKEYKQGNKFIFYSKKIK